MSILSLLPRNSPFRKFNFQSGPSIDPGIEVMRQSPVFEINSKGILTEFADNTPVIGYRNGTRQGLRVSSGSSNQITNSNIIDYAYGQESNWASSSSGSCASLVAPDVANPLGEFGDVHYFKLLKASNYTYIRKTTTGGFDESKPWTFSIHAKAGTNDTVSLIIGNTSSVYLGYRAAFQLRGEGSIVASQTHITATAPEEPLRYSSKIEPLANGWYRCSITVTFDPSATAERTGVIGIYPGRYGSLIVDTGVYVWGAQLESSRAPTPYIPTQASAKTRSADFVKIKGMPMKGTFVVRLSGIGSSYLTGQVSPFTVKDEQNNYIRAYLGDVNLMRNRGGFSGRPIEASASSASVINFNEDFGDITLVCSYDGNTLISARDGIVASAALSMAPKTHGDLIFGSWNLNSGHHIDGFIKSIDVYTQAFDAQQCAWLSYLK